MALITSFIVLGGRVELTNTMFVAYQYHCHLEQPQMWIEQKSQGRPFYLLADFMPRAHNVTLYKNTIRSGDIERATYILIPRMELKSSGVCLLGQAS